MVDDPKLKNNYVKGSFDRGELADKFVVLVKVDSLDEAVTIADIYSDEMCTVHQVVASSYDIDYDVHKITMSPAYRKFSEPSNG